MNTENSNQPAVPLPAWGCVFLGGISRREFLRQSGRGLLGLFLLPFSSQIANRQVRPGQAEAPEIGRVLDNKLSVYDRPSFSANLVNMYWRDVVLPIDSVTIGDKEPAYNRVWYQVNNKEGYVHSGKVQPVSLRQNKAVLNLPEKGALAEVTVPFTDALKDQNRPDRFAYRLYYSTVFWVKKVVKDKQGRAWYQIPDDKLKITYFANAEHLRLIPSEELAPITPHIPIEDKRIEIRLKEQLLVAYEEDLPVFMTRIASGGRFIEGDYSTPTGQYVTNRKRPSRHMASGDLAAPSAYDLPGVPWVCYLTKSGISLHGTYWHNDFGKPRSHGCINLTPQAAHWVYRWSLPTVPLYQETWIDEVGTQVEVVE
jgi:hypothetical protein